MPNPSFRNDQRCDSKSIWKLVILNVLYCGKSRFQQLFVSKQHDLFPQRRAILLILSRLVDHDLELLAAGLGVLNRSIGDNRKFMRCLGEEGSHLQKLMGLIRLLYSSLFLNMNLCIQRYFKQRLFANLVIDNNYHSY